MFPLHVHLYAIQTHWKLPEPEIRGSRYISLHFLGDTSTKGTTNNFIVFIVDAGLLKTALCDEKTCSVYFQSETSNK